jgi:ABC-type Fe3+-hydroxamate transport system substrate-binding protein
VAAARIVSLCPSITETLAGIGALPSLVGVTRYCVRPKGLLASLARVGGMKTPDLERIVDLRPDLVLANEEENRREDVVALRARGIAVDVTFPRSVADVPAAVRHWGSLLSADIEAEAEALAVGIEEELRSLEGEAAPARFSYAYWIWKDPWMTVNDDTYVADLLRLAGGANVFGRNAARYPTVSPQDALSRGAEVCFFASEPFPFRPEKHQAQAERLFGRERKLLFVDGDDYCWHGLRTLDGLKAIRGLRITLGKSNKNPNDIRQLG